MRAWDGRLQERVRMRADVLPFRIIRNLNLEMEYSAAAAAARKKKMGKFDESM